MEGHRKREWKKNEVSGERGIKERKGCSGSFKVEGILMVSFWINVILIRPGMTRQDVAQLNTAHFFCKNASFISYSCHKCGFLEMDRVYDCDFWNTGNQNGTLFMASVNHTFGKDGYLGLLVGQALWFSLTFMVPRSWILIETAWLFPHGKHQPVKVVAYSVKSTSTRLISKTSSVSGIQWAV